MVPKDCAFGAAFEPGVMPLNLIRDSQFVNHLKSVLKFTISECRGYYARYLKKAV